MYSMDIFLVHRYAESFKNIFLHANVGLGSNTDLGGIQMPIITSPVNLGYKVFSFLQLQNGGR